MHKFHKKVAKSLGQQMAKYGFHSYEFGGNPMKHLHVILDGEIKILGIPKTTATQPSHVAQNILKWGRQARKQGLHSCCYRGGS